MNQYPVAAAANSADAYLAARIDKVVGRAGRKLAEAGLETVADLLRHFPKRYEDPRVPTDMALLRLDEMVTINAQVKSLEVRQTKDRRQWLAQVGITDGTHQLGLTFFLKKHFLVDYYQREYRPGRMGLFTGRVGAYRGALQLVHPEVVWEDQGLDPRFAERLIPIYPAVAGVQSPVLQRAVQTALAALGEEEPTDPLPDRVLQERQLLPLGRAFWNIHTPAQVPDWIAARRRFRFEEAFALQVGLARRRHRVQAVGGAKPRPALASPINLVSSLDARLPFQLTASQQAAGAKLAELLGQERPMNQLLQGDVGSGKTVVALRAMLQVVDSAGQAVLLAPTEVLAVQHFQTIRDLLGPLVSAGGLLEGESGVGPNVGVSLLTGSVSGKARDLVLEQIASGAAGIVVGTHALLEGTVQFRDLGLVVIDEQHRFGVEQRDALRARSGSVPHLLVMTATPIPRTVAMTVFGDLGVTILDSSPPGRGTVSTTWVNPVLRPSWIPRVWERVTEEVQAGRRAFVVCPAIEPGEVEPGTHLIADQNSQVGQLAFAQQMLPGLENQPENGISATSATGSAKPLAAVSQVLERLESEPILQGARLAPLHGRMSSTQKDQTMAAFQAGEIDVLVATTVIEVGIDVPEATALVVLDADRFGLSQLHQLRGRVGRGSTPAVCLLVSEAEPGTPAALRLEAMERTTNGFELAEVDLQTRREGQILGDTQSGSSSLRLVRLAQDAELVLDARAAAEQIVTSDPDLTEYPRLRFEVDRLLAGREAYLERG